MRHSLRFLLPCLAILLLLPGLTSAQVSTVSPPDGAELTSPPDFSWTADTSDVFVFLSVFYYEVADWAGYYPVYFWLMDPGFAMPTTWWDKIGEGSTNYWAVFGYNTVAQQGEWSNVATFTKVGCIGQCAGEYTFDCNPGVPCICFTTTEGGGACIDDFYCDSEPCATSADCPAGKVCITCSFCDGNRCAYNECTDGGPRSAPLQGVTTQGVTEGSRLRASGEVD